MAQLASSVINRVPLEVWLEIFFNLRTSSTGTQNTYKDSQGLLRRSVLSVSQICSQLREITIKTPQLWTSIFVDFESPKPAHNLMITKLWLARSKDRPLSITLFHIPDFIDKMEPTDEHLVRAAFSQVPRWKEAFLSWESTEYFFWRRFDELIGQPSLLESLTVDYAPKFEEDCIYRNHVSVPEKLWTKSPRLQRMVVIWPETYIPEDELQVGYCLSPEAGLPQWVQRPYTAPTQHIWHDYPTGYHSQFYRNEIYDDIPYSQLTHLRLDNTRGKLWTRNELIRLFNSSPKLIVCFIEGIILFEEDLEDKSFEPVVLQHLRDLSLGCTDDDDVPFIQAAYALDYITAPSLVTLTILGDQVICYDTYRDFTQRSSCLIEEINFLNTIFRIDHLIHILRLLPSLRAIHLHNIDCGVLVSYNWHSGLSAEERYRVCPNLEQLSLSGPSFLDNAGYFLDDVFDTWLNTPTDEPRTFRFLIPSTMDSQVQPDIRSMCEKYPEFTMGFNDHMLVKGGIWDMYADR